MERFIVQNGLAYHTVPNKECPQCHRTLVLVGVASMADWNGAVIFHYRCPIHLQDYAVNTDDGTLTP